MQTGKKAVETVKETASNIAASAKSGMDKTKATVQEKVDNMRAHDDFEKDLAKERKENRITEAELRKQTAQVHNLDEKEARTATNTGTHSYSTTGGHVVEGTAVGSHPIGIGGGGTATTRSSTAENRHVGGVTSNTGLTGSGYSG